MAKARDDKNPRGRPTKYQPEFCDVVIDEMKKGATLKELPLYLDVCLDTINEWRKIHEDFSVAIKKGLSYAEAFWMKDGRESLRDDKFNSTLWYMNMKNRFGWADKQETKAETNGTLTLTLSEEAQEVQAAREAYKKEA